jgi:hypothetical protein
MGTQRSQELRLRLTDRVAIAAGADTSAEVVTSHRGKPMKSGAPEARDNLAAPFRKFGGEGGSRC